MNSDSPKMPREEMESWLTSLLLGELSAGEAAAVRELIKHDPELAKLHDDLKSTIQLVREVTVKATVPAPTVEDQPKLSRERREKVLAQFKTIAPKEFAPEKRQAKFKLVEVAAVLAILCVLAAIAIPSLSNFKSRGYSGLSQIDTLSSAPAAEEIRSLKTLDPAAGPNQLHYFSAGSADYAVADGKAYSFDSSTKEVSGRRPVGNELTTVTLGGISSSAAKAPATEPAQNLGYYRLSSGAQDSVATPAAATPPPATPIVLPALSQADSPAQAERNYTVTAEAANRTLSYGRIQVSEQPVTERSDSGLSTLPARSLKTPNLPPSEFVGQATAVASPPPATVSANSAATEPAPLVDPATGLPVSGNAEPAALVDPSTGLPVAVTVTGDAVGQLRAGVVTLGQETLQRDSETLGEAFRRRYMPAQTASTIPHSSTGAGGRGGGAGPTEPNLALPTVSETAANNGSLALSDTAGVSLKAVDEGKSASFGGAGQTRGVTLDGTDRFGSPPSSTTTPQLAADAVNGWSIDKLREGLKNGSSVDGRALGFEVAGGELVLGRTFTNSSDINGQWGDNSQHVKQGNVRLAGSSPARPAKAAKPSSDTPQPLMGSESLERYEALVPEREKLYAEERGRLEQLKSLDKPQLRQKLSDDSELRETSLGLKVAEEKLATLQKDSAVSATDLEQAQKQVTDLKKKADDQAGRALARLEARAAIAKAETDSLKESISTGKALEARKSGANQLRYALEDLPARKPATNAPIPQPEIQTSENNFSTFSLNVSDVSFKLAAASLEEGQMPDVASIRSEEFINAFDYRDPEPLPGAPIAFAWERARYPFAHSRDLLRFSLKTAAAGRQAGRPMNIVLLLDNSGSMERADRVRIIHEALRVLAGQLQPQDKLSVITFARTPRLFADGAPGSDAGAIARALTELTPEGGTNLEEAMNLAYQTAAKHYLANGINRVVLLTDGAANLGDVEPESLKQKVEAARVQGIALDCFGIGWDGLNDDLLEVLSRNGDGRYGFINSPEEAATEFVGQLAGALKVAASDVKVQVEFNPRRVTTYRQIGYAKHQLTKEQFRDNTVDAAEIAAQEAGNALYTVEVIPAGNGPIATVRVRYKIPGTTEYREQAWDVPYTGNAPSLEQSSPAIRLAASSAAFAEWLVASPFAGEVSPDALLGYLRGVPEVFGADSRPKTLEWMIRQAKSIEGK